jgi:lipid II:glycine glycyltransferase (peptidoglycan interpeptide bridge formation enzyme)
MLLLLAGGNFRQFAPLAWESARVDLGLDLESLRKQLDSKWRNMLSFSERAGLVLDISEESTAFEWILDRYQENMQVKNFQGPSIELLRSLRGHLYDKTQLIVLRALIGGEAVAGICLVPHGVAATYLLGWNGSAGRNLKANQFLLWNAILHLKQRGLRWFDLGGIESERNPGITSFKLGLNGERYEYVGEFWKW